MDTQTADPATGSGSGTSAPSEAVKAEAATTTYQTFIKDPEGAGWLKSAEVTVKAGRADLAKQKALEAAAKQFPDQDDYSVAVTSRWTEETFELEQPKPRFVAKKGA